MSEIVLDHAEAARELTRMVTDGDEQRRVHRSRAPELEPGAAGRDFTDRGEAIARMLRHLHGIGGRRLDVVVATADAARKQVQAFRETDGDFADSLGRRR